MSVSEGISSMRSLSEVSEEGTLRFSVDLVAAARRNLGFLRIVSESQWLHHKSTLLEAIRRFFFVLIFILTIFRIISLALLNFLINFVNSKVVCKMGLFFFTDTRSYGCH